MEAALVADLVVEKLQKDNVSAINTRATAATGQSQPPQNAAAMAVDYYQKLAATAMQQNQMLQHRFNQAMCQLIITQQQLQQQQQRPQNPQNNEGQQQQQQGT